MSARKNNGTFSAVGKTEKRMLGTPAILISGFATHEVQRLETLLAEQQLAHLPRVYVDADLQDHSLAELAALGSTQRDSSGLRRAIVVSGATGRELHILMKAYREAGLPRPLWASVTRVSAKWPMRALLEELGKEKAALHKAMQTRQDATPGSNDTGGQ